MPRAGLRSCRRPASLASGARTQCRCGDNRLTRTSGAQLLQETIGQFGRPQPRDDRSRALRLNRIAKRLYAVRERSTPRTLSRLSAALNQPLRAWNRSDLEIFAIDNRVERAYLARYLWTSRPRMCVQ